MKQSIFEVLIYLFENYLANDDEPSPDRDSLESELFEAGFTPLEIRKAFDWLDGLADNRNVPATVTGDRAIRVYHERESLRLDVESRGFILFLEQAGILDRAGRELVIDRLMALEDDDVDLDTVKWVVLMVLFNQPGQEEAFNWMEDLLFDNPVHLVH